ncbi:MAG: hypothetical protein FJ387_11290 [Verrucomicrobia bacterium]|nr:hypothetical protein [Verrucomicrobiota bacterium]
MKTPTPLVWSPEACHTQPACGLWRCALAIGLGLWTAGTALAFPPAPHHILYGVVRDELGQPLWTANATVVLETATGVQVKTPVVPNLGPNRNYRLRVPMDAGLTADNYRPTALRPLVAFRMKVVIGGVTYLPIETRADYANLGKPAQSTRLDLTLGEDTDGDGLPDAWERALIAMLGSGLTLADIRPGDDADGDGLSNLQEYLAGTYAFDPQDGFRLDLFEIREGRPLLEFMAIRGRTYTLLGSADLETWTPIAFRIADTGPSTSWWTGYSATDTRLVRLEAEAPAGVPIQVFKLLAQ